MNINEVMLELEKMEVNKRKKYLPDTEQKNLFLE